MTVETNIRRGQNSTLVEVTGEINSSTSAALLDELLRLTGKGRALVIDLHGVDYVSSAGLRTLLVVYREAQRADVSVQLAGLSDEIRFVMSVTGFLDFFEPKETKAGTPAEDVSQAEGALR